MKAQRTLNVRTNASRVNTRAVRAEHRDDPWASISHDVISRFLDVLMLEHALARKTRVAYRLDLHKLDCWMQLTHQRSSIAATSEDLQDYFDQHLSGSCSVGILRRARNSARRFYGFLLDCHYRDDDPMVLALAGRALEVAA
jgi:site-specific recombinase XerD